MPLRNCKFKQWNAHYRIKPKTLTKPNIGKKWRNKNAHPLMVGIHNYRATLKDTLGSYKAKHNLICTV